MSIRKIIFMAALAASAVLLISCGSKQNKVPQNSAPKVIEKEAEEEKKKNPTNIEKTMSSGIKVDAQIEIPEGINSNQIKKYTAKLQELDFDKVYDRFIGNQEILEKNEGSTEDLPGNGTFRYYRFKDGKQLTCNGGVSMDYSAPEYANIQVAGYAFDKEETPAMNQDFSFETRENAKKQIDEFFRELEINVYSEYKCYALDYKWLREKNEQQMNEEWKEELIKAGKLEEGQSKIAWNEDLNGYLFQFQSEIDHIPVSDQLREVKNRVIPAPYIYVMYSKDKIAKFTILDVFEALEPIAEGPMLNVDQALELLDQKYNSIIMEGEYTLTKIRLEYVPDLGNSQDEYTLIPAWHFYMVHRFESPSKEDESKLEMNEIPSEILFDAMDGTEIITGVGI